MKPAAPAGPMPAIILELADSGNPPEFVHIERNIHKCKEFEPEGQT